MSTRNRSSGSFARAKRSASAARGAVARARKPAVKKTSHKDAERSNRSANRNEVVAKPERSLSKPVADGVRLQKALADAGIAARRDCEQLILNGRIQLNGRNVVELPCFINPERDIVSLDGVPQDLSASIVRKKGGAAAETHTYVLINKPKGMITTARDPEGRPTVLQMVPHAIRERERLFPVGRLDADSTGLLILTNDGDLAYQLTHPKFGVVKEYRVTTTGLAGEEQLQQLKRGVYLLNPNTSGDTQARRTNLEEVRVLKRFVDRSRGDRTVLSIKLREGQNREIRRLLARVGLKVRDLERVAIGPLRDATLKPGQTKLLGKRDVDKLRAATLASGEKKPARRTVR
jgi:23S rRNA pseudouridine2605 synthase